MPESRFETTLLDTLRAIEHDQQTAGTQDQADNSRWWPPSPSWAIVYVTVVYVIVAICQWSGIRRQATAAEAQASNLEKTLLATEKAAEAAKLSADAAVAGSVAHLHLMRLWIEGREPGGDIMDGGVGVVDPMLHYGFTNYGKTPAFLIEMCWESLIAPRLPAAPIYKNRGEIGHDLFVVAAEQDINHKFKWSHLFEKYLTEDDVTPVRRMEQRLYVYGFFRYRDAFERHWRVGFAYYFNIRGQAHVVAPDVAPAYWYRQLEK